MKKVDTQTEPLSEKQLAQFLNLNTEWLLIEEDNIKKLKRSYKTKNYQQSLAFTNAIATLAEQVNHHPLIILEYNCVTVFWWTHTSNSIHQNDLNMALKTNEIFNQITVSNCP